MAVVSDLGLGDSLNGLRGRLTKHHSSAPESPTERSVATTQARSVNSSLLTTPHSPNVEADIDAERPYKAGEGDNISLSMKRRHTKHRRRLSGSAVPGGAADPDLAMSSAASSLLKHARSLPLMNVPSLPTSVTGSRKLGNFNTWTTPPRADGVRQGLPRKPRRWTLPSKSNATPAVPTTHPAIVPPPKKVASTQTPAAIALRRARTCDSRRTDVYTSFPEFKFQHQRVSFFANVWPQNSIGKPSTHRRPSNYPSASRRASIVDRKVLLAVPTAVAPVCTELQTGIMRHDVASVRRCSTKYVSRTSVYEVIWDENSTERSNSPGQELSTSTSTEQDKNGGTGQGPNRRHSVAMDKLEMQLSKAVQQSRRSSSVVPEDRRRSSGVGFEVMRSLRNFSFAAIGEEVSRVRSRSKGSITATMGVITESFSGSDSHESREHEVEGSELHVEFFPPLRGRAYSRLSAPSRPATVAESPVDAMVQAERSNWDLPEDDAVVLPDVHPWRPPRPPGVLIGSSTRLRRHSSNPWRRKSTYGHSGDSAAFGFRRRSTDMIFMQRKRGIGIAEGEEDTVPLLGPPTELQT